MKSAEALISLTPAELTTWFNFLNAHSDLSRRLHNELEARHQIALAEFTVLQQLAISGGQLRMTELAETVVLSPSGTSRLVDRMVAGGLIERRACEADGRVIYAAITERGRDRLAEVEPTHAGAVRRLFMDRFSPEELQGLSDFLLRLAPACRARLSGS